MEVFAHLDTWPGEGFDGQGLRVSCQFRSARTPHMLTPPQEHVTEYGVHWNFFFTLAVLPIISIAIRPACETLGYTQMGIMITGIHQSLLSYGGLESWILSPTRKGLIGMNKEGLVSLPGYLGIYILSLAIGRHVMRSSMPRKRIESVTETQEEMIKRHYEKRRAELGMELLSYAIGWWLLLLVSRFGNIEVSRRMVS